MDKLASARVFVAVHELGSIALAADHLEMPPAMVSRHVRSLEKWLQVDLLQRSGRSIKLTPAGESALSSCRALISKGEALLKLGKGLQDSARGSLRISASANFIDFFLIDGLAQFQELYPNIVLSLIVSDLPLDMASERIDVSIRISKFLEPNLICKHLCTTDVLFCASPTYLRAMGTPTRAEDLENHRFVMHALHDLSKMPFNVNGKSIKLNIKASLLTSEISLIRKAVLADMGIALLPYPTIASQLQSGELVQVAHNIDYGGINLYATYLSRQYQPLALRLFIEFLDRFFSTRKGAFQQTQSLMA